LTSRSPDRHKPRQQERDATVVDLEAIVVADHHHVDDHVSSQLHAAAVRSKH